MITNCPAALPEMAALLAMPRRRANQRLIITPMIATDVPALPTAKTSPYSANTCQRYDTLPMRPMPTAVSRVVAAITTLKLYRSTNRPRSGIESADTMKNVVAASESEERVQPRSSVIGFSTSPKAKRDPLLKNSTTNPAHRMTEL